MDVARMASIDPCDVPRTARALRAALLPALAAAILGCRSPAERTGSPSSVRNREKPSVAVEPAAQCYAPGYLDLDVVDADPYSVLEEISAASDVPILADPGIEERATLRLDDAYWWDALELVARLVCGTIVVHESTSGSKSVRLCQPSCRGPVVVQDSDIRCVLELLAKQIDAEIVTPPDLQGRVSFTTRCETIQDLLRRILLPLGYDVVAIRDDWGRPVLHVVPIERGA
jgi:hypothetical protein